MPILIVTISTVTTVTIFSVTITILSATIYIVTILAVTISTMIISTVTILGVQPAAGDSEAKLKEGAQGDVTVRHLRDGRPVLIASAAVANTPALATVRQHARAPRPWPCRLHARCMHVRCLNARCCCCAA